MKSNVTQQQKKKKNANNQPTKKKRVKAKTIVGKPTRASAIGQGLLITPEGQLKKGVGVLDNILVGVNVDPDALAAVPLGVLSLAMTRGLLQDSYAAYSQMYLDISNLMSGGNGVAPTRLRYMNDIYQAFTQKNIPFRSKTSLSYKFTDVSQIVPSSTFTVRNHSYYMFNPDAPTNLSWNTQSAPGVFTAEQLAEVYNAALASVSGDLPHTKYVKNVQLTAMYAKDASAYSRNSLYYGAGCAVGSPYGSCEGETAFNSRILGTFTKFDPSTPRSSRFLRNTSGDSCSNYAIGALDIFPTSYYNGAVPPIYKFLDIDELCFTMGAMLSYAYKQRKELPISPEDAVTFDSGFGTSYQAFSLMVRQQVLAMFNDSQNLAQFIVPDTAGTGFFEAFRCGSNCCPRQQNVNLNLPQYLNENLKMLRMCVRNYDTKQYNSPRNHITHIPVWGKFINSVPGPIVYYNSTGAETLLFNPIVEVGTPNIWDCSTNTDVIDVNTSSYLYETALRWNEWMNFLMPVIGTLEVIGGSSAGSPLLQFTRYVVFSSSTEKDKEQVSMSDVRVRLLPQLMQQFVVHKEEITERKLEKSKSSKEIKVRKYYNPPGSTIYTEATTSVSGMVPITDTHKVNLPNFILPVIELLYIDNLPSQAQIQVSTLEPYSMIVNQVGNVEASRAAEIIATVPNMIIGVAGRKSGLADFIEALSKQNQGGFFGDLFSTVGNVASSLGFGGVGTIAKTAGGIANALNV